MRGPCASLEHWSPQEEAETLGQMPRGLPRWLWGPNEAPYQRSGRASWTEVTVELGQEHATQSGVKSGGISMCKGLRKREKSAREIK